MKVIPALAVVAALALLAGCAPAPNLAEAPVPVAEFPPDGSTMLWVDGSALIGIQCNDHDDEPAHFMWLHRAEVSGYMYNMCVEAGGCDLPPDAPVPMAGPAPMGIIGPERAAGYCDWIGGELLTDEIIAEVLQYSAAEDYLDLANPSSGGFRCSVGTSHVTGAADGTTSARIGSPMCETSPVSTSPAQISTMSYDYELAGTFCQGGKAYATIDLVLGEDEQAIGAASSGEGRCDVVERDRVVCFGEPGSGGQGTVAVSCNGFIPGETEILCNGFIPAESNLTCLQGYVLGPGSATPSDWQAASFTDSSLGAAGQLIPSSVVPSMCLLVPPAPAAPAPEPAGGADGDPHCPVGTYFDAGSAECTAPFALTQGCMAGFAFDEAAQCCRSELQSARSPGCPPGQSLNPETGACDSRYLFADGGVIQAATLEFELGACAAPGGGAGGQACQPPSGGCGDKKWDPVNCVCY